MRRTPFLCMTLALAVMGCYTFRPITTGAAPEVGTRVGLHVNDAGRAALAPTVGSEIDWLDGRLVEQDADGFTLAVQHVYSLRGAVQIWAGEQVRVRRDQVHSVTERQLAKGRTLALSAAGAGGVAFMLSRGLFGSGLGEPPEVPTDSGESLRVIWP